MGWLHPSSSRFVAGLIAVSLLAAPAVTPMASAAGSLKVDVGNSSVLFGSLSPTSDTVTGQFHSARMSIEVALAPQNQAALNGLLTALYNPRSSEYHRWLATGQFDARFGPSQTTRAAVARYLQQHGLTLQESASPFLVRASGSSQQVSAAFHIALSNYVDPQGIRYFYNATPVELPSTFVPAVLGVVGLSNTVREHPMVARVVSVKRPAGRPTGSSPSCETPYVTTQQLFNLVNNGVAFPYGYGGGPGCNGLTPSQTNSIYGAPGRAGPAGPYAATGSSLYGAFGGDPRTQGAGVNLAVFEFSAYTQPDITTWAQTFYGPRYTPRLVNILVDGGPLAPACPSGDRCPPNWNGYAGDIEVDADIEQQLAISPDAKSIEVYEAPNDWTGQTNLDLYSKIADDNTAATRQPLALQVHDPRTQLQGTDYHALVTLLKS